MPLGLVIASLLTGITQKQSADAARHGVVQQWTVYMQMRILAKNFGKFRPIPALLWGEENPRRTSARGAGKLCLALRRSYD